MGGADAEEARLDVPAYQFVGKPFRAVLGIVEPPPEPLHHVAETGSVRPVGCLLRQVSGFVEARIGQEPLFVLRIVKSDIDVGRLEHVERPVAGRRPGERRFGQRRGFVRQFPTGLDRFFRLIEQYRNVVGALGERAERLLAQLPFARPDTERASLDRLGTLHGHVNPLLLIAGNKRGRRNLEGRDGRHRSRICGQGGTCCNQAGGCEMNQPIRDHGMFS